jgi:hypothetical protein
MVGDCGSDGGAMNRYERAVRLLAPKSPKEKSARPTFEERVAEIDAGVVAQFAEGNMYLQRGLFWTAEDAERETEMVCRIDFGRYRISES